MPKANGPAVSGRKAADISLVPKGERRVYTSVPSSEASSKQ